MITYALAALISIPPAAWLALAAAALAVFLALHLPRRRADRRRIERRVGGRAG